MKMIYAIVQDEDAGKTLSGLTKNGFSVTRLATSGGFLRAGNTTLLVGVEDDQVDKALKIIEEHSRSRKQMVPSTGSVSGVESGLHAGPMQVTVGGATVFVVPVEKFLRL